MISFPLAINNALREINFNLVTIFDEILNVCFEERQSFVECVAVEYAGKGLGDDERYPERRYSDGRMLT